MYSLSYFNLLENCIVFIPVFSGPLPTWYSVGHYKGSHSLKEARVPNRNKGYMDYDIIQYSIIYTT